MRKPQLKKLPAAILNKICLLKFNYFITAFIFVLTTIHSASTLAGNIALRTQCYTAPSSFNTLHIHGPVNVTINGNTTNANSVELTGDTNSINHVQMKVERGTLFLDMQPEFNIQPNSILTVTINSPSINNINYSGTGKVSGINLHGILNLTSTGQVQ